MLRILFFFIVCKIQFFGFIEALDTYAKRVVHQPYNVVTRQIISCLLSKFISPEVSVINLFANLQVFLERLADSSKFLDFLIEVS